MTLSARVPANCVCRRKTRASAATQARKRPSVIRAGSAPLVSPAMMKNPVLKRTRRDDSKRRVGVFSLMQRSSPAALGRRAGGSESYRQVAQAREPAREVQIGPPVPGRMAPDRLPPSPLVWQRSADGSRSIGLWRAL